MYIRVRSGFQSPLPSNRVISDSERESESESESESVHLDDVLRDLNEEFDQEEEVVTGKKVRDLSIAIVPPIFAIPCGYSMEPCPICFEPLEMVNLTVTTCGHSFHSSCMFKALQRNDDCPLCRNQLMDSICGHDDDGNIIEYSTDESENESENDDNDSESENDDNDSEEEDMNSKVSLDELANKLKNLNYSMKDILRYFIGEIVSDEEAKREMSQNENVKKYNGVYLDKLSDHINSIIDGTLPLSQRDTRSYAQVTSSNL